MKRFSIRQLLVLGTLSSVVLFVMFFTQPRFFLLIPIFIGIVLFFRGIEVSGDKEIEFELIEIENNEEP